MKIAIIGAGAAGMMTAATICEEQPDAEIVLIEKNSDLGRKVIISGGGRCNVTTGWENPKEVLLNYPRGNKFLISAMFAFGPKAVQEWFENHGVPLKREDDGRVFPVSDNGEDVVGVFKKIFANSRVQVMFGRAVVKITCHCEEQSDEAISFSPLLPEERARVRWEKDCHALRARNDNGFKISFRDNSEIFADVVVLSLGGQAYRHTGSTGDGYTLAEALGHTITQLAPSLHSFVVAEKWPGALAGMSFIKATISADCPKPNSKTGPFLFTHRGISGPAVFAVSSLSALAPLSPAKPLAIFIDFLPEIKMEELKNKIQNFCKLNPKKNFKNTLHQFLPLNLVESLANEFGWPINKKNGEISKAEIHSVAEIFKKTTLHAIGRGAGEEFVTAGGVELSEVDPKTMESKKCPNLYFAGEILNVDGFTGGFNLQAAWATGRLAGVAILKEIK